eukprot:jgi/Chlat1/6420/Chrsp45S05923
MAATTTAAAAAGCTVLALLPARRHSALVHSSAKTGRPCFPLKLQSARQTVIVHASAEPSSSDSTQSSKTQTKSHSILCTNCDGNGAVVCNQCQGTGRNTEDFFQGRFKAGETCWLCRGKRQMLCGDCNGAGFIGGFMSTQEE